MVELRAWEWRLRVAAGGEGGGRGGDGGRRGGGGSGGGRGSGVQESLNASNAVFELVFYVRMAAIEEI